MNTKNPVTEQFLSVQGEGRSVGRLAYFIRFAGCNLWCGWCDSMHSVDPAQFKGKTGKIRYEDVPDHCKLIVLTGGEPTLFDLVAVRSRLASLHRAFEVESNAVSFPERPFAEYHDLFHWNLSPKLKSSRQKNEVLDKKRLQGLAQWARYARGRDNVTFKFVVSGANDLKEVDHLAGEFRIAPFQIYLMPEGTTPASQALGSVEWILDHCKARGYNFSTRLHILFWGDKRGI